MTQEEKAKAYDEALEIARQIHNGNPSSGTAIVVCEQIFPELTESEDERIRKGIIKFFSENEVTPIISYEAKQAWIAWLERQKEQKDFPTTDEGVKKLLDSTPPIDVPEKYKTLDWLFKKQKEQKPELVQHPPITYTYPSDASRDERLKAALLALLNSDLLKVKEGGYFTKQDLIEWVEKQKVPSWKPSEEQMEALDRCVDYLDESDNEDAGIIESLYERLKQL